MATRTPIYCSEDDVYYECGMDSEIVQEMKAWTASQVTTLINRYILSAEKKMNDQLGVPITRHTELHKGTGEDDEFELGSEDEFGYFTINLCDQVEEAYACYFSNRRMKRPYPKNCDLCEKAYDWDGVTSNCIVTDDQDGSDLGSNASVDEITITVADGDVFNEGDRILIKDDNGSQYAVIKSIDGNTLTLTSELRRAFTTAANAKAIGPIICGDKTLRFVFSDAGYARYPRTNDNKYINKNIDIFDFFSFKIRCSDATATITFRLYDKDGNYNYFSMSVDNAYTWQLKSFDIDSEYTGSIDWDDIKLYYIEIHVDKACTIWLDNFNFNDEWFITYPKGLLCIARMDSEEPPADGYPFHVTYSYNPYLHEVPHQVREATAKFAAIKLLNFLIGIRQRDVSFGGEGESGISRPDRDQLYFTRSRLDRELKDILKEIGYGFEFTPV